jgi:hypothetical protein
MYCIKYNTKKVRKLKNKWSKSRHPFEGRYLDLPKGAPKMTHRIQQSGCSVINFFSSKGKTDKNKTKRNYRFILAVLITLGCFFTFVFALCMEVLLGGNYFEMVAGKLIPLMMIILGYYFLSQKKLGGDGVVG